MYKFISSFLHLSKRMCKEVTLTFYCCNLKLFSLHPSATNDNRGLIFENFNNYDCGDKDCENLKLHQINYYHGRCEGCPTHYNANLKIRYICEHIYGFDADVWV